MNIKQRILLYFTGISLVLSSALVVLQQKIEEEKAIDKLSTKLATYCDIMEQDTSYMGLISDTSIRISVFNLTGDVLFDSSLEPSKLPNHSKRREFQLASKKGSGYDIRKSSSNGQTYFYYIKAYPTHYVRAAKPYEEHVSSILDISYFPVLITLAFFIVATIAFYFVARGFGNTINALKQLIGDVDENKNYKFPKNEFGEIGQYITNSYRDLLQTQEALAIEREKLLEHLRFSQEGLAIFDKEGREIISNPLFIQHINTVAGEQLKRPEDFLLLNEMEAIKDFIKETTGTDTSTFKKIRIIKFEKIFEVESIIFKDCSFEVSIQDISQQEEQATLKRQLTQHISHELKTPVSSILGFTETLISQNNIEEQEKTFFIKRCHAQALRLSSLIQDISTLNKLDEDKPIYRHENLEVSSIVDNVVKDVSLELKAAKMSIEMHFEEKLPIAGNYSLLYSIFRNLCDNSILYAGSNTKIQISCYRSDEAYYYFSFSDTGMGVKEEHLNRIFERFYRIDKGRSRKLGGTGLGLAIVKNAVNFHQGHITAKLKSNGGLAFLFTLKKSLS